MEKRRSKGERGGGDRGSARRLVEFLSSPLLSAPLRAGGSVKDLAAWSPPPPPPPPPRHTTPFPFPPTPLKSLRCAHSCSVHITSPAPSYTPPSPTAATTTPPQTNDSRARPFHKATAFSTSRACTHARNKHTRTHARALGHTRTD